MTTTTCTGSVAAVEYVGGRSRVVTCRSEPPLRLLTPDSGTTSAWIVQSTYGGGLVQGDAVLLRFRCGPAARVLLGTQSNGRVYRHLQQSATARQDVEGTVEAGGLAVVFPDPLVLHAESRFAQKQHWEVATSGNLVLADWFQCGRSDNGECFAYAEWSGETSVSVNGRMQLLDRFRSTPAQMESESPGRFGSYRLLLNLYAVGSVADGLSKALEPVLAIDESLVIPAAGARHPPLRVALNRLENTEGFVLRALGMTREDFDPLLERCFACLAAPGCLGFNPLVRRV